MFQIKKNKNNLKIFIAIIFVIVFLILPISKVEAAIVRVQTREIGNNSPTITATWLSATKAGNLLVAIVSVRGGSGTTITPPAGLGWTLARRSNNGTTISTAIYYIENAAAQSGGSLWTLSSSARATLTLVEYSGAATSSALDQTATSSGSGTTGSSGTTATTTQINEVAVAGISANNSNRTFSTQSNSFSEVSEVNSGGTSNGTATVFEEKILSSVNAQNVSAIISSSSTWSGVIATFKAAVGNPIPTTTSISPTNKTVGDAGFTLTVNGTNFVAGSVVNFAGSARTTTFVNSTQLTAAIPNTDLTTAGTYNITVTNPLPGGGTSNAQAFIVGNIIPTTTSISPTNKTLGDAGFTLTVNGSGFVSGAVVKLNGNTRVTSFVNSSQLLATIIPADLSVAGTFLVVVTNPLPGGGTSNAQIFTVHNIIPSTTSIFPTSKPIGSLEFIMTVYGNNFSTDSLVKFAGSLRSTIYVSATQLQATILTSDLVSAGTFSITVYNPTTLETSNAQHFTVGALGRHEFNYSKTFYGSGSLRKR
jgi:hypothetical protein